MQSNLEGRLKNFKLIPKDAPFCIYESVVNSIQSYPDEFSSKLVKIDVIREMVLNKDVSPENPNIQSIVISDNGIGFNERNFQSFKTLDETTKPELGCKGVGRLTWLKVFDLAEIESVYLENEDKFKRSFKFSAAKEVFAEKVQKVDLETSTGTTVKLSFKKSDMLTGSVASSQNLMMGILSHCIKYFVNSDKSVDVEYSDSGSKFSLREEFEKRKIRSAYANELEIKGYSFQLSHLLLKNINVVSKLAWCAHGRVVLDDSDGLKDIPKVLSSLHNSDDKPVYVCLIESPYLNENVAQDRTGFYIEEKNSPDLMEELDFSTIRAAIKKPVSDFLRELIKKEEVAGIKRKEIFVQENPRFKPLMEYSEAELEIGSKDTDKQIKKQLRQKEAQYKDEIDEVIERATSELENRTLTEVHEHIESLYQELMSSKATALNYTALTEYVIKRKAILTCFEKALEIQNTGEYQKEDFLHNMILPMHCDSTSMYFGDANLWLLDDRLAFHNYIASDIQLKGIKIADLKGKARPDIATLTLCNYEGAIGVGDGSEGRIEIVEFKRPMRKDKEVFQQIYDYAQKISDSKITSYKGRPVKCSGPIFAYIVSDIDKELETFLINMHEFRRVEDGFLYKAHKADNFTLVVEALSYDYILKRATQRNQAFFSMLGID